LRGGNRARDERERGLEGEEEVVTCVGEWESPPTVLSLLHTSRSFFLEEGWMCRLKHEEIIEVLQRIECARKRVATFPGTVIPG
jgi:hypothetical protein